MPFEKLPPADPKDIHIGCLNCSTAASVAPMDMIIAVGFGAAYVTKNGQIVYDGEGDRNANGVAKTVEEVEAMAAEEPDNDWRIVKDGPMHGETFQRHGPGQWVCVMSDRGFA